MVPRKKQQPKWERLDNGDLITFAEVKKLIVYPMLLAHFVGIIHEIMPNNLNSVSQNISAVHFDRNYPLPLATGGDL